MNTHQQSNTSTQTNTTPCLARLLTHVRTLDTVNIWRCDVCGASVRITLDMRGDLWRHDKPRTD